MKFVNNITNRFDACIEDHNNCTDEVHISKHLTVLLWYDLIPQRIYFVWGVVVNPQKISIVMAHLLIITTWLIENHWLNQWCIWATSCTVRQWHFFKTKSVVLIETTWRGVETTWTDSLYKTWFIVNLTLPEHRQLHIYIAFTVKHTDTFRHWEWTINIALHS